MYDDGVHVLYSQALQFDLNMLDFARCLDLGIQVHIDTDYIF